MGSGNVAFTWFCSGLLFCEWFTHFWGGVHGFTTRGGVCSIFGERVVSVVRGVLIRVDSFL